MSRRLGSADERTRTSGTMKYMSHVRALLRLTIRGGESRRGKVALSLWFVATVVVGVVACVSYVEEVEFSTLFPRKHSRRNRPQRRVGCADGFLALPAGSHSGAAVATQAAAAPGRVPDRLRRWTCCPLQGVTDHLGERSVHRLSGETPTGQQVPTLAMRMRGLEPPRGCPHTDLNRARLPIPPHPRGRTV